MSPGLRGEQHLVRVRVRVRARVRVRKKVRVEVRARVRVRARVGHQREVPPVAIGDAAGATLAHGDRTW